MASGTGNLPNDNMVFTPYDVLTAEEQNQLVENIESLADGSGIGDEAITTAKIDDDAVTPEKLSFSINYSTTEQNTGRKWIDNKTVFMKVVDIGSLPNNSQKAVPHGISNLDTVISLVGTTQSGSLHFMLPYTSSSALSSNIAISISGDDVLVTTGTNRTGFSGYAIIEYTKT